MAFGRNHTSGSREIAPRDKKAIRAHVCKWPSAAEVRGIMRGIRHNGVERRAMSRRDFPYRRVFHCGTESHSTCYFDRFFGLCWFSVSISRWADGGTGTAP